VDQIAAAVAKGITAGNLQNAAALSLTASQTGAGSPIPVDSSLSRRRPTSAERKTSRFGVDDDIPAELVEFYAFLESFVPAGGIFDENSQWFRAGDVPSNAADRQVRTRAILKVIFDSLARAIHAGALDEWVHVGPDSWPVVVGDIFLGLIEDYFKTLPDHIQPAPSMAPVLQDHWNEMGIRPVQLQPIFYRREHNIRAIRDQLPVEPYQPPPQPLSQSSRPKRVHWPSHPIEPRGIARLSAAAFPTADYSRDDSHLPAYSGHKRDRSRTPSPTVSGAHDDQSSHAMQASSTNRPMLSFSSPGAPTRTVASPFSGASAPLIDPKAIPLYRFLPPAAQAQHEPAFWRAAARNVVTTSAMPSIERLQHAATHRPTATPLAPVNLSGSVIPTPAQIRRELRAQDLLMPHYGVNSDRDGGSPMFDPMALTINPRGYGDRGVDSLDPASSYKGRPYEPGVTPESTLVWMSRFIKAAIQGQWNDKLCLENLRSALAGPAAEWYENLLNELPNDEITFANVAEKLIQHYEGRQMSVQDYRNMVKAGLRHEPGDTVAKYISKAEVALSNPYGQWNEITRVEAIADALHPTIKNFMKTHAWGPFATVTDLHAHASKAEAYIRRDPVLALQYKQSPEEVAADLADKAQPRGRGRNIPITAASIKTEPPDNDGGMNISPPVSVYADLQARIASLQQQVDRPRTPPPAPTIIPMPIYAPAPTPYSAPPASVAAVSVPPTPPAPQQSPAKN
jgi:hypothetical protein